MATRRTFLLAAAALPLAGCTVDTAPLRRLERRHGARLGVHALDTATGREIAYRADERFGFCSTFKGLAAAAVLDRHGLDGLDRTVRYGPGELMPSSFVTAERTAMTLRELCDAAVRHSDGTAGNLLMDEVGGPRGLTRYLRGLGDRVSRIDSREPRIAEVRPGDPRDTTTPRAIGADYRRVVLEDALPSRERAFLRDLLERNTTGDERIRAGLPRSWTVADKTGTGTYGTANDIAIAWPPRGGAPIAIAIMTRGQAADAEPDEALIAETAAFAARTLRPF